MASANIIQIDEDKCIGCGKCANTCPHSALRIIDGKARLVGEWACDGLGVCMGDCPTGALKIVPRTAASSPAATTEKACPSTGGPDNQRAAGGGCPGMAARTFARPQRAAQPESDREAADSALTHWPIQLRLINPQSPVYRGAEVVIAADCTAFSLGGFHRQLLEGRALIIACPKLDTPVGYREKLVELFTQAQPSKVLVARMSVPCCAGLSMLVDNARREADSDIPVEEIVIDVSGEIISRENLNAGAAS